jgi:AcrR family transcriptional regulator
MRGASSPSTSAVRVGSVRRAGSVKRVRSGRGSGPVRREGAVQVSEVQRARILAAMVRVVAEQGVGSTTVSRVVKRAGVSRRTFYEQFSGCEDCFLAVFEDAVGRASGIVTEATVTAPPVWRERLRAGLGALLGFFDEEPLMGSLLVVDALGAGPRVLERRAGVLAELAVIVGEGHGRGAEANGRGRSSSSSSSSLLPSLTAEGMVGAVLSVIHVRMVQDDRRPLLDLLNPLMGMIVLPYLGRAAAARELARPVPKSPRGRASSGASATTRVRREGSSRDPLEGLEMRLTYRTLTVLSVIAADPGASNRRVGEAAGVHDQGQISKLLARLNNLGLIQNTGHGQPRGEPNAWTLTTRGMEVQGALGHRPHAAGRERDLDDLRELGE